MNIPFMPIPAEALSGQVGKIVHVLGWKRGCQFRLVSIGDGLANLVTPKTGKEFVVKASQLAYTRANEPPQGIHKKEGTDNG